MEASGRDRVRDDVLRTSNANAGELVNEEGLGIRHNRCDERSPLPRGSFVDPTSPARLEARRVFRRMHCLPMIHWSERQNSERFFL